MKLTYPLKAQAQLFVSADNQSILYLDGYMEKLYSVDGKIFREVRQLGFCGSADSHHFAFEDVHDSCRRHDVWRQGDLVLFDGDKIGDKKYANDDDSKPFVTINGVNFVLDDAVVARHGLTAEDVVRNKPGNIRHIETVAGGALLIGSTEMRTVPRPDAVSYLRLPTERITQKKPRQITIESAAVRSSFAACSRL